VDKITKTLPCVLIVLTTFAAYSAALLNGFALDDVIQIEHNRSLQMADYGWTTLTAPVFPGNLYRPLTSLSYYFENYLWGLNPLPYHFFNILLHACVAVLFFALSKRVLSTSAALLCALVFAVHPLFVEVVANVSGRAELLSALFILSGIGIALFAKRESLLCTYRFSLVALFSFLAAASKESGLMMTVLLCLVFFVSRDLPLRSRLITIGASLAGAVCYLSLRVLALGGALYSSYPVDVFDNPLAAISFSDRVFSALSLQGLYLFKIFYPLPLSADYSALPLSFSELFAADYSSLFIGFTGLITLSLITLLRKSYIGAGIAWFFLSFLLTSNIFFPIGTVFAERLAYVPSMGILCCVALALDTLRLRALVSIPVIILITLAFMITRLSAVHWFNNNALADYQEHVSPESFRTQLLLARRDKERGDTEAAKVHLKKSLALLPQNDEAYHLLAIIALEEHNLPVVEENFKRALIVNSDYLPSLSLYARLLLNQDKLVESRQLAEQILRVDRKSPDGLLILLALAMKNGDTSLAHRYQEQLDQQGYKSADFDALKKRLEN
jgi:protein O-mannosyl-transferase